MNKNQSLTINHEKLSRKNRLKHKAMDLETEIPVWYLGRMKWISNLTSRSTCSDIIDAILSADECRSAQSGDEYLLFESWRGVERPLKPRCRLLKLWHSWAGESDNVTLTLRPRQQHPVLIQQDKKLDKLKRELKRTDRAIKKLTNNNNTEISMEGGEMIDCDRWNSSEGGDCLVSYLCVCRSILRANTELERQQTLISRLTADIERESRIEQENQGDLARLLSQVSQTLVNSRRLTEESDKLDDEINRTNEEIDRRQVLLDELELDIALDEKIDMTLDHDSLDDEDDRPPPPTTQQERVSTSPPPVIPPRTPTVGICRPTAIVEPSPSSFVNSTMNLSSTNKCKLSFNVKNSVNVCRRPSSTDNLRTIHIIPFPIRHNSPWSSSLADESDTGISSLNSADETSNQLITLV